jgi:hypothetical protein
MHLSLHYVAIIVVTIAFLTVVGVTLLFAAYRSVSLPVCLNCGAREVHRSRTNTAADIFAGLLFLVPYRCWVCQRRFYGFRTSNALRQAQIATR